MHLTFICMVAFSLVNIYITFGRKGAPRMFAYAVVYDLQNREMYIYT